MLLNVSPFLGKILASQPPWCLSDRDQSRLAFLSSMSIGGGDQVIKSIAEEVPRNYTPENERLEPQKFGGL